MKAKKWRGGAPANGGASLGRLGIRGVSQCGGFAPGTRLGIESHAVEAAVTAAADFKNRRREMREAN